MLGVNPDSIINVRMFTSLAAYSEEKAQRKRPPRRAVESVTQTLSPCQMCRGMSGRPNVTEASMAKKQASAYRVPSAIGSVKISTWTEVKYKNQKNCR